MADMGRLISEADAYGDVRFDEGAASRQAEVDQLQVDVRNLLQDKETLSNLVTQVRGERDAARRELADHLATHVPDEPVEPPAPAATTRIGMSALPGDWAKRLAEVGAGVTARRIFADFTADGRAKASLIEQAIKDGMTPVVSYKGTPSPANVAAVRAYLASLNVLVYATWHHEPYDNMGAAEYITGARAFLAAKSSKVKVGPIFHGWLLDSQVITFATYTNAELLDAWDFVAIDSYETAKKIPGDRIPVLTKWLADQGKPSMPIVIGEYNGKSADSIARSGEVFLTTPQVAIACMWNNTGSGGAEATPLSGDRLAAFRATLADPRAKK